MVNTTVNFIVRRKVGADEIEVRLASVVEKGAEDSELRRLAQASSNALKEYVQNIAPSMPTSRPTGAEQLPADGAWYDVEEFTFTKERGKAYLKARTAQWVKHGLTIWPEVWKAAGIPDWNAAEALEGKNPPWKIFVGMKNGKAHALEMLKKPE